MTPELPSDFDYSRTDLEGVLQMIETGHMSVACASYYIKNIFEIIDAIKARTKSPNDEGAGSEKCPMCNPDKEAEAECHNPACPCPNHDLPLKPAQAGLSVEEIYQALLPIPSVHVPISQMNGKTYHYMCKYDIATAIFEAINRGS